ncbi:hypothetical protein OPQ81_009117 [Rhizoctonia solani]|nr:hypothetical protein OPQ81_009117 [Rhizoctonia solani]
MSMSKAPYVPQLSASFKAAVQDISRFVHLNEVAPDQYEEAGFGASANVFRGMYTREDGRVVKVAVKCMRPKSTDESEEISREKINKRVARELSIWHSLNEGRNIVELLGIFTRIKSMPSLVCELCPFNLQEYMERKSPPPKHIKMITDTLRGLSFMHGLPSGPIAHGDVKLSNILVTSDEIAKLCDFGRSRKSGDPKCEVFHSSTLAGTIRYMSPELFSSDVDGPTLEADMWAYGCVALEVMSGILPVIAQAAHEQVLSMTRYEFLNQLLSMLQNGDIPSSPILPDLFPSPGSGYMEQWPEEVPELVDHLEIEEGIGTIASSVRANVWLAALVRKAQGIPTVAVKVPRLNTKAPGRHEAFEQVLRKMVKGRFGVRHKNIIDLMGIDSSFEPHPGLVLEYCASGNLVSYCKANRINRDEYKRPPSPIVNAYSLMSDILEGLRYMHSYPIPIPQGDLTPENILVASDGTAKINLFSFGRALASLPPSMALSTPTGLLLPFRWMSPELLADNPEPTTESDMWAVGCICYWVLTGLVPYLNYRGDLAGIECVRGQPPGTLANVYYGLSWITNGIWRSIGRCWSRDPLHRPSALEFSNLLKVLEGKRIDWLPVEVEDLAGKVRAVGFEAPLMRYTTVWREFHWGKQKHEIELHLEMAVYQTTYVPKWYSRTISVGMKVVRDGPIDGKSRALIASIRHEITIMSQLDHPHITKLLGIDSSHNQGPAIIFQSSSGITLDELTSRSPPNFHEGFKLIKCIASAIRYLHDHENGAIAHGDIQPANIYVLLDGQAKLTNFTCAFQYILGQPTVGRPLSSIISTPLLPSLYFEPQYYNEKLQDRLRLPTTAGDIWSLGTIILSLFTSTFRQQNPDVYSTQIRQGVSPCDMHQLPYGDHRVSSLVRSMLAYECSERPSARTILDSLP